MPCIIKCVPFPELPLLFAQLEKAKAERMAKLSAAIVDFSVVFMGFVF